MLNLTIIDSKIPKILDNINQDAKYLFKYYFIYKNKVLPFETKDSKQFVEGHHYIDLVESPTIPELHNLEDNQIIVFASEDTFTAFKNTKRKEILSFTCKENMVYMDTPNGQLTIGTILGIDFILEKFTNDTLKNNKFVSIGKYDTYTRISDELKNTLMDKCITFEHDTFKIRMSKRLLPNVKAKDTVGIYYTRIGEKYFNAVFEVTRESGIKIYHSYDFINY